MKKVLSAASLLTLVGSLGGDFAWAEYRMFTLRITNTKTQEVRFVDSTLDPHQYGYYFPVKPEEQVVYTDTWRCYGRTGDFKPACPSPRSPASAETPVAAPASGSGQNLGPGANANP